MTQQQVQEGKVVYLAYTLHVDGELVDEALPEDCASYLHGGHDAVEGLEEALLGLVSGDRLRVEVPPEKGYGHHEPDLIERVERSELPADIELVPGSWLTLEDDEGYVDEAKVLEIDGDEVVLDYNHALVDKTLAYQVEVLGLRDATAEELEQGFANEEFEAADDPEHRISDGGAGEEDGPPDEIESESQPQRA
jgi:FKBP-type peptidyl-prolyl cis-trans isomerase SlyD